MKIALLIDIDNAKVSLPVFKDIIKQLNQKGNLLYAKVYGYNERKHMKFDEVIDKYAFECAPTMRNKKRSKSQLDTRIIIDAVKMYYTMPHIDAFCIVAGIGNLIPLLSFLKAGGRTLMTVKTEAVDDNDHMFDEKVELSIAYRKPIKLTKKQLNQKLKDLSERTSQVMEMEDEDASDELKDALISEIEDILAARGADIDEDEASLYDSLESLLDIIR